MLKQSDVNEYAARCKELRPNITEQELTMILRAKFVEGKDPLDSQVMVAGLAAGAAVSSSQLNVILGGLKSILQTVFKWFKDNPETTKEIQRMIARAVVIAVANR